MSQARTEYTIRREDIPFTYSEPSEGKSEGVIADFDEFGRLRTMYSIRKGVMNGPYLSIDYDTGEASSSTTKMFPDPIHADKSGETLYHFIQEQLREIGRQAGRLIEMKCAFCSRSQEQVKKLVAGPNSYICNECIELCVDILADEQHEDHARGDHNDSSANSTVNNGDSSSQGAWVGGESSRIADLLEELDELLSDLGVSFDSCWNPPASEKELEELAECLGSDLPTDFIEFYRSRNGSPPGAFVIFPDIYRLLSSNEIIDEWKELYEWADEDRDVEVIGPVKPQWWNLNWLPVGIDDGNPLCLDLDPPDDGTYGQVVKAWHDWERRSVQARSLTNWLEEFVEELRRGKYMLSESGRALVNCDE